MAAIASLLQILAMNAIQHNSGRLRSLGVGLSIEMLILLAANLVIAVGWHRPEVVGFEQRAGEVRAQVGAAAEVLGNDPDALVILRDYGAELRCCALRLRNRYTANALVDGINVKCGGDRAYGASIDLAELPQGSQPLADAREWYQLIVRSTDVRSDY